MSPLEDLKKANKDGVVLGLKNVSGVAPRKDIDVFMRDDPDTFNLFVLALRDLQSPAMSADKMGYFEIAGIHGMPLKYWDGVEGKENMKKLRPGEDIPDSGYCAHGTIKFPTWHRPYVSMLEQSLYLRVLEIAGKYEEPHKTKYLEAAQKFRLPFWDYFRPRAGEVTFPGIIENGMTSYPYDYSCPKIFTSPTIMVREYPENNIVELKVNPLSTFEFKDQSMTEDWKKIDLPDDIFPRTHTVRYPRPNDKWGDSISSLNKALNAMRMDTNRLVLTMIEDNAYGNYDRFASNGQPPEPGSLPQRVVGTASGERTWDRPSGSLEALHGLYHLLTGGTALPGTGGGGGHMSEVPVAAFDPIFWFHHCQIDRLFEVWQAVHEGKPDSWFSDATLAKDSLLPFRKTAGNDPENFWNSNESKGTEDFGYVYNDSVGPDVLSRFKKLYEWSVPLRSKNTLPTSGPPSDMMPIDVTKTQFFGGGKEEEPALLLSETTNVADIRVLEERLESSATQSPLASNAEYAREWYIDDQVERLALNGAFTIFYFIKSDHLGVPSPTEDYTQASTLAGMTHIFAAPVEMCDNCGRQEEQAQIVTNTSAITSMLLDFVEIGELENLEAEKVVPFLKNRLRWRVTTINGEDGQPRQLSANKHFRINVSCKISRLPRGSDVVRYEDYPEIVRDIVAQAS